MNDGLSSNSVLSIIQDNKGFMWIGTSNGLNRYDGYNFVSYFPEKGKISLIDNRIKKISENKNGFLWIYSNSENFSCYDLEKGCFVDYTGCGKYADKYNHMMGTKVGDVWLWHENNGCQRIIYKNGKFRSQLYKSANGLLPSNKVKNIVDDSQGNIWIITDKGAVKVSQRSIKKIGLGISFVSVHPYRQGCFLLSSDGCVYDYKERSGLNFITRLIKKVGEFGYTDSFIYLNKWIIMTQRKSYVFDFESHLFVKDEFWEHVTGRFVTDNAGNYLVYNGTGFVYYINEKTRKTKKIQLIPGNLVKSIAFERYHILQDNKGLIWISTYGNGLFVFNPETDDLTHYNYRRGFLNSISSNYIISIFKDREENIWIANENSGLSLLSVINEGASHLYLNESSVVDRTNEVRMINRMKNGDYCIANRNGGLYYFDKKFFYKSKTEFPFSIFAILEDQKGHTWLGSRGDGLSVDGKWYRNNPMDSQSISWNHIYDLVQDNKGRMWIATLGGGLNVAIKNGNGYKFSSFLMDTQNSRCLRTFVKDHNGWIWVGGNNGVYIFNPDTLLTKKRLYLYNKENGKLGENEVHCLFQDKRGRMWIGTSGDGVFVCSPNIDYSNLIFRHYGYSDGLVNNSVQSIIEDKDGKIWIATECGISRLDSQRGSFDNFFFSPTIQGNFYSESCAYLRNDGILLFGSRDGLVVIDPKKVVKKSFPLPVVLTNLKINGITNSPRDIDSPLLNNLSYTRKIQLKYSQNSFIVEFSTLDYFSEKGVKYSYRMDNYDKEWSEPSSLNFAAYKNMEPGKYILHIKACNASGLWTKQETKLEIVVLLPFWKTKWAFLFYFIIFVLSLYVSFRLITKYTLLNNRLQFEKQLTDFKLSFFTNVAHEFRAPLTLIQGGLNSLEKTKDVSENVSFSISIIKKSSQRLMRLIEQILTFRKLQNNKLTISIRETDIISFAKDIYAVFYESAHSKNIEFRFIPFAKSYKMYIDTEFVDKILYNLLSNALKFTPENGSVTLYISKNDIENKLLISVADTGLGIPKDKQTDLFKCFAKINDNPDYKSFGIGLNLVSGLVTIHHGTISYQENQPQGSIFKVELPLSKDVYSESEFASTNNEKIQVKESANSYIVDIGSTFHKPLNNIRLLIIDDDEDIREYIRNVMSVYFVTEVAFDALSGIKKTEIFDPNIILCDVLMPGMSGYEFTKHLKKDKKTNHIPIVLLTSLSDEEEKVKGYESGADAFISKPFSVKLLLARIINIIEQRQELKEKFAQDDASIKKMMIMSSEQDKKFIDRMNLIIEHNMTDPAFSMDDFAAAMGYKRTLFFQKVSNITGITPNEYLRDKRMKKAAEMLLDDRLTVAEVAYQIGFSDPSYFGKNFRAYYGMSPSQFQNKKPIE